MKAQFVNALSPHQPLPHLPLYTQTLPRSLALPQVRSHLLTTPPPAHVPLYQRFPRGPTQPAHLREGEEGSVAPVQEGAADHLQDEGDVLEG